MNQDYENTRIPETLSDTVRAACQKAAREERRRRWMRYAGVAVAACAALVITVNVPAVATALKDVPVIGSLVRVLQIGGGGEQTDGVTVIGGGSEGSTVRLSFQTREGGVSAAPAYTVQRFQAPERLTFTLNGVRGFDLDVFEQALKELPQVRDFYRDVILDDSAIRFTIVLNSNVGNEVSEYQQPGYIDLRFYDAADLPAPHTVYFLRSNSMPQGESLALLAEMYHAQGASVAPTQTDGEYTVTLGVFDTQAEAEALYAQLGNPAEFWVDSCENSENPK